MAGYSENTARSVRSNVLEKPGVQGLIAQLPNAHILAGNTTTFFAKTVHKMMKAKEVKIVGNGEDAMAIDVEDNKARAKGSELWLKSLEAHARITGLATGTGEVNEQKANVNFFVGNEFADAMLQSLEHVYAQKGQVVDGSAEVKPDELLHDDTTADNRDTDTA